MNFKKWNEYLISKGFEAVTSNGEFAWWIRGCIIVEPKGGAEVEATAGAGSLVISYPHRRDIPGFEKALAELEAAARKLGWML